MKIDNKIKRHIVAEYLLNRAWTMLEQQNIDRVIELVQEMEAELFKLHPEEKKYEHGWATAIAQRVRTVISDAQDDMGKAMDKLKIENTYWDDDECEDYDCVDAECGDCTSE
jgi:Mg/Co/Ni transporter MgtE